MPGISLATLVDTDIAVRWFESDVTEVMRLQLLHTQQLRNQQQLLANQARLLAAVEADTLVGTLKPSPKLVAGMPAAGVPAKRSSAAKTKPRNQHQKKEK